MGADLNLIVISDLLVLCTEAEMKLTQNSDLWDKIKSEVQTLPLPAGEAICRGGDETTDTDPYGDTLRYAGAGELVAVMKVWGMTQQTTAETHEHYRNNYRFHAAVAYLDAVPNDKPVVLYWY